jgi:hypothetical protein
MRRKLLNCDNILFRRKIQKQIPLHLRNGPYIPMENCKCFCVSGCIKSLHMWLRLVGILFIFVFTVNCDRYDQLCDEIVSNAQLSVSARKRGKDAKASKYASAAFSSLKSAIKENDREPQAYLNYAQFLLNANRPLESIEYWESARSRTRSGEKGANDAGSEIDAREWIDSRIKLAKYAHYSMQRDKAYSSGQGNITEALSWAEQQLAVYNSPTVMFDMATLEVPAYPNRSSSQSPRSQPHVLMPRGL